MPSMLTTSLAPPDESGVDNADNLRGNLEEAGKQSGEQAFSRDSSLTARWLSNTKELEALEPQWRELIENTDYRNIVFEPCYLIPALEHLADSNVRVMIVEQQHGSIEKLVGLVPFSETRLFKAPLSAIEVWQHDLAFDSTPLLRSGFELPAWQTILDRLRQERYSLLNLSAVFDSPAFDQLLDSGLPDGIRVFRRRRFSRAAMVPGASYEEYVKRSISSGSRRKYRRLLRNLEKNGKVSFETLLAGQRPDVMEEFFQLEQAGWKGKQGTALASNESTEQFFRDMAHRCLAGSSSVGSQLRFKVLRLDGHAVALLAELFSGRKAYSYKIAYDETYSTYSPGIQLLLKCTSDFHAEDIELVDSCADPDNQTINRLWSERLPFQSVVIPLKKGLPNLLTKLMPLAQRIVRTFRR